MIEVVLACIQLVEKIRQVGREMTDNWADCNKLILRCGIFDETLQAYSQTKTWTNGGAALTNLQNVLEICCSFICRFTKRTYFRGLTRLMFRKQYAEELAHLHKGIDEAASMFHIRMEVDNEVRRQQDMIDAKLTFHTLIDKVTHEIVLQGEDIAHGLDELRKDIADFTESLKTQFQLLDHIPLTAEEVKSIGQEMQALSSTLEERHKEIMQGIRQVLEGNKENAQEIRDLKLMMHLFEARTLSSDAEKQRASKLEALRISRSNIKLLDKFLGQGGFGVVRLAQFGRQQVVAVKTISPASSLRSSGVRAETFNEKQIRVIENEILLTEFLRNPCVMTVYGYVRDPREVWVVMELAPFGSLERILSHSSISSNLKPLLLLLAWLQDLASALDFIHSKKVKHLDVKPHNLLVFAGLQLKLCDFGLAKEHRSSMHGTTQASHQAGTTAYMAPEIRNGRRSAFASDIFSFAMTAVHILTGYAPMVPDADAQIRRAVRHALEMEVEHHGGIPTSITSVETRLSKTLQKCTQVNDQIHPDALRPTATQLFMEINAVASELGEDPRGIGGLIARQPCVEEIERLLQMDTSSAKKSPAKAEHSLNKKLSELTEVESMILLETLGCKPDSNSLKHGIDGEVLVEVETIADLVALGVQSALPIVRKALRKIQEFQDSGVPAAMFAVQHSDVVSNSTQSSHVLSSVISTPLIPPQSQVSTFFQDVFGISSAAANSGSLSIGIFRAVEKEDQVTISLERFPLYPDGNRRDHQFDVLVLMECFICSLSDSVVAQIRDQLATLQSSGQSSSSTVFIGHNDIMNKVVDSLIFFTQKRIAKSALFPAKYLCNMRVRIRTTSVTIESGIDVIPAGRIVLRHKLTFQSGAIKSSRERIPVNMPLRYKKDNIFMARTGYLDDVYVWAPDDDSVQLSTNCTVERLLLASTEEQPPLKRRPKDKSVVSMKPVYERLRHMYYYSHGDWVERRTSCDRFGAKTEVETLRRILFSTTEELRRLKSPVLRKFGARRLRKFVPKELLEREQYKPRDLPRFPRPVKSDIPESRCIYEHSPELYAMWKKSARAILKSLPALRQHPTSNPTRNKIDLHKPFPNTSKNSMHELLEEWKAEGKPNLKGLIAAAEYSSRRHELASDSSRDNPQMIPFYDKKGRELHATPKQPLYCPWVTDASATALALNEITGSGFDHVAATDDTMKEQKLSRILQNIDSSLVEFQKRASGDDVSTVATFISKIAEWKGLSLRCDALQDALKPNGDWDPLRKLYDNCPILRSAERSIAKLLNRALCSEYDVAMYDEDFAAMKALAERAKSSWSAFTPRASNETMPVVTFGNAVRNKTVEPDFGFGLPDVCAELPVLLNRFSTPLQKACFKIVWNMFWRPFLDSPTGFWKLHIRDGVYLDSVTSWPHFLKLIPQYLRRYFSDFSAFPNDIDSDKFDLPDADFIQVVVDWCNTSMPRMFKSFPDHFVGKVLVPNYLAALQSGDDPFTLEVAERCEVEVSRLLSAVWFPWRFHSGLSAGQGFKRVELPSLYAAMRDSLVGTLCRSLQIDFSDAYNQEFLFRWYDSAAGYLPCIQEEFFGIPKEQLTTEDIVAERFVKNRKWWNCLQHQLDQLCNMLCASSNAALFDTQHPLATNSIVVDGYENVLAWNNHCDTTAEVDESDVAQLRLRCVWHLNVLLSYQNTFNRTASTTWPWFVKEFPQYLKVVLICVCRWKISSSSDATALLRVAVKWFNTTATASPPLSDTSVLDGDALSIYRLLEFLLKHQHQEEAQSHIVAADQRIVLKKGRFAGQRQRAQWFMYEQWIRPWKTRYIKSVFKCLRNSEYAEFCKVHPKTEVSRMARMWFLLHCMEASHLLHSMVNRLYERFFIHKEPFECRYCYSLDTVNGWRDRKDKICYSYLDSGFQLDLVAPNPDEKYLKVGPVPQVAYNDEVTFDDCCRVLQLWVASFEASPKSVLKNDTRIQWITQKASHLLSSISKGNYVQWRQKWREYRGPERLCKPHVARKPGEKPNVRNMDKLEDALHDAMFLLCWPSFFDFYSQRVFSCPPGTTSATVADVTLNTEYPWIGAQLQHAAEVETMGVSASWSDFVQKVPRPQIHEEEAVMPATSSCYRLRRLRVRCTNIDHFKVFIRQMKRHDRWWNEVITKAMEATQDAQKMWVCAVPDAELPKFLKSGVETLNSRRDNPLAHVELFASRWLTRAREDMLRNLRMTRAEKRAKQAKYAGLLTEQRVRAAADLELSPRQSILRRRRRLTLPGDV